MKSKWIKNIVRLERLDPEVLSRDIIWVWHVDKIPPHIGVSSSGRYYSLKSNGKDEDLPANKVINILHHKKIPSLLFEVSSDFSAVEETFNQFNTADGEDVTCLTPISVLINEQHTFATLHELLEYLDDNEMINMTYGLHMEPSFKGLKKYDRQAINSRIKKLKNVKREKHISEIC